MINIEKIWFYAALAACLGGGFGAGVAVSPSKGEIERAAAYNTAPPYLLCEETTSDRTFRSAKPDNSPPEDF